MDLIFHNGKKLYNKHSGIDYADFLEKQCGLTLYHYQKQFLNSMIESNKPDYAIVGDDFKVEIIPNNVGGNCVLSIKDYDENQNFENEINIDFTKDELDQFINLLSIVKSKMR